MYELPNGSILYANSARGVYIPQFFAESVNRDCVSGISIEALDLLLIDPNKEPENDIEADQLEWYWDNWAYVLDNAVLTDPKTGIEYYLWQDGDLWLVPVGAEIETY